MVVTLVTLHDLTLFTLGGGDIGHMMVTLVALYDGDVGHIT